MRLPDDRAQSIQVGVIILFAFAVIAFTGYQAYAIPDQNREVEFNHFRGTQDNMESVRNSVIEAGASSRTVPAEVKLGTRYPTRILGVQSPSSTGALVSDEIGGGSNVIELNNTDAGLTEICGTSSVRTQSLVYQPNYNYLQTIANVSYENTVSYTTGTNDQRVFLTEQDLVDDTTLQLYPLEGEYGERGNGVATVTLTGGTTGVNDSVPGSFSLILPTRLTADQWSDLLSDEPNVEGVAPAPDDRQAVEITFASGETYSIRCSPVGLDGAPNNRPTETDLGGDVILSDTIETGPDNQVELKFKNTDPNSKRNLTALRFQFYFARGDKGPPDSFVYDKTSLTFNRAGQIKDIPAITFGPDGTRSFVLNFKCGTDGNGNNYDLRSGDYFVLNAYFQDGTTNQYFVGLRNSGGGNNRCKNPNNGNGNNNPNNGNGNK